MELILDPTQEARNDNLKTLRCNRGGAEANSDDLAILSLLVALDEEVIINPTNEPTEKYRTRNSEDKTDHLTSASR